MARQSEWIHSTSKINHPSKSGMNLTSTTYPSQPTRLFLSSEFRKLIVCNSHVAIVHYLRTLLIFMVYLARWHRLIIFF